MHQASHACQSLYPSFGLRPVLNGCCIRHQERRGIRGLEIGVRHVRPVLKASAVDSAPIIEQGSHLAILQGLGNTGDVPAEHLPWLLRIADIRYVCPVLEDVKGTCSFQEM